MQEILPEGFDRSLEMQKRIKPIDVFIGEASDGHAELAEASLRDTGIVNNLYRGRDGAETFALVRDAWRGCKDVTLPPLLVLLDCGLPRVGALDVLGTLKSDWRYSWVPVIMMTTTDDRRQAEEYRHLGCEAYVTKWAVFLGLPGFVTKVRSLTNRAVRIASCRRIIAEIRSCGAGTLDLRSMSDVARTCRHRQAHIGKEVKDGSATP